MTWMGTGIGHEELFGPATLSDAQQALAPLAPIPVLRICGRISTDLFSNDPNLEAIVLDRVLRSDDLFRTKLARLKEAHRRRGSLSLLLDDHRIANLARQALLHCSGPLADFNTSDWKKAFTKALLIMNDVAAYPASIDKKLIGAGRFTAEDRLRLSRTLMPLAINSRNQNVVHTVARTKLLFIDLPAKTKAHAEHIDLDGAMVSRHGVHLLDVCAAGYFFLGMFSVANLSMHANTGLLKHLQLAKDTKQRVVALLSQTIAEAQRAETAILSARGNRFEPFDHRTLAQRPIIRDGDMLIAPSYKLLVERVSSGFYYWLLDAVPDDDRKSQRFFNYCGHLFEIYCQDLVQDLVALDRSGRTTYEPQPLNDGKTMSVDGALVEDQDLVLFEFKGGMFNLQAGAYAEEPAFLRDFEKLIVEAAEQLLSSITMLKAGASIGGRSHFRRITPVVVTHQPLSQPFVVPLLVDRAAARKIDLAPLGMPPVFHLHVSELENIFEALRSTKSTLSQFLHDWTTSPVYPCELHNYLIHRGYAGAHNPKLKSIADPLYEEWQALLDEEGSPHE